MANNKEKNKYELAFKNANFWTSKKHWEWATDPNSREKASFLDENLFPIKESGQLKFINNRAEFNPHVDIDLEISHMIPHLHEVIRKPMYGEVAEQLTRLSNVLQCQLPNEEGLQEYFKILAEFPLVLLEECVEYIIQTARYRKLPLPIDFIAHMEVSRTVHVTWLDRLERLYINYKE